MLLWKRALTVCLAIKRQAVLRNKPLGKGQQGVLASLQLAHVGVREQRAQPPDEPLCIHASAHSRHTAACLTWSSKLRSEHCTHQQAHISPGISALACSKSVLTGLGEQDDGFEPLQAACTCQLPAQGMHKCCPTNIADMCLHLPDHWA